MDLLSRFRRRESGLVVPEHVATEPRALAPDPPASLPPLPAIESVDALVRARIVRDEMLRTLADFRRREIRKIEARVDAERKKVWVAFREDEKQARAARRVA